MLLELDVLFTLLKTNYLHFLIVYYNLKIIILLELNDVTIDSHKIPEKGGLHLHSGLQLELMHLPEFWHEKTAHGSHGEVTKLEIIEPSSTKESPFKCWIYFVVFDVVVDVVVCFWLVDVLEDVLSTAWPNSKLIFHFI